MRICPHTDPAQELQPLLPHGGVATVKVKVEGPGTSALASTSVWLSACTWSF